MIAHPSVFAAALLMLSASAAFAASLPEALARLSCTACLSEKEARSRFSDEEWKDLEDGDEITRDQTKKGHDSTRQREAEAFGLIAVPPAVVWSVLLDFEGRPKFMPNSASSAITKVDGNKVFVRQKMSIMWEDIHFSVINSVDAEKGSVDWVMDSSEKHDIADTQGTWQIVPIESGRHTLLMYHSHTDTGRPVPAMIESFLVVRSLPKMIDAVRKEANRRSKDTRYLFPADSSETKKQ